MIERYTQKYGKGISTPGVHRYSAFRRLPPVCVTVSLFNCLCGRLRFSRQYLGSKVLASDGQGFTIFRHLKIQIGKGIVPVKPTILVVRFRFKRFSHLVNQFLSLIPIPLISGFPGFRHKLWMVCKRTGYWQGLYEFESAEAVDAYILSFVLGIMNSRADKDSRTYEIYEDTNLEVIMKRLLRTTT